MKFPVAQKTMLRQQKHISNKNYAAHQNVRHVMWDTENYVVAPKKLMSHPKGRLISTKYV